MPASDRSVERLAKTIARLEQEQRRLATATRLGNSSIENRSLEVRDADGNVRQVIGLQPDGTATTVDKNGPPPPAPTAPVVTSGPLSLSVAWDGGFVGGAARPSDFAHVEVHVSDTAGFEPTDVTQQSVISGRSGSTVVSPLIAGSTYYVVLVAVSTSKVESAKSSEASGIPDAAADIGPGSITETEIADDSISTPKLRAEAVTADKIAANSITAGQIQAGAITASELSADAVTGKTVTGGVVRTAVSGARVELDATDDARTLSFWSAMDDRSTLTQADYSLDGQFVGAGVRMVSATTAAATTPINPNTGFEVDTSGWWANECTFVSSTDIVPEGCGKLTATGTDPAIWADPLLPVTDGRSYSFSVWLHSSIARDVRLTVAWFGADQLPWSASGGLGTDHSVPAGEWFSITYNFVVPIGCAYIQPALEVLSSDVTPLYVDDVRISATGLTSALELSPYGTAQEVRASNNELLSHVYLSDSEVSIRTGERYLWAQPGSSWRIGGFGDVGDGQDGGILRLIDTRLGNGSDHYMEFDVNEIQSVPYGESLHLNLNTGAAVTLAGSGRIYSPDGNPIFTTFQTGGNVGVYLGGSATNRVYITAFDGTGRRPLTCSSLQQDSDPDLKADIVPLAPETALAEVLSAPAYSYVMIGDDSFEHKRGLMSTDMPSAVAGQDEGRGYIDPYGTVATLWSAVQELTRRLEAVENVQSA